MGILSSGLIGPVRNKVGPTVNRVHRGLNVVTPSYRKTNKPATDKQLEKQTRFGLLNSFLSEIESLVKPGFIKHAKHGSEVNAAYKFNYPHAFLTEGEVTTLNFPEITYSRGRVFTPDEPMVTTAAKQLEFSWAPQNQYESCRFTDLASFLVYNPAKKDNITCIGVADRYSGSYGIPIPDGYAGDTLHCYMSFASANGKLVSDSVYVGTLVFPAQ